MPTVRCQAVRWVSDEPFPGWVEVHLTSADGYEHAFFDKPPMFEAANQLRRDAEYPFDIEVDCSIETDEGHRAVVITMTHVETADGQLVGRVSFTVAD